MNEPQIHDRAAQPYAAIRARVRGEAEFRRAADRGFPELFRWPGEQGTSPVGPMFIRYLVLDHAGEPLDIELAAPVRAAVSADGRVRAGTLPAGRWATFLHVGPYNSATAPDLAAAHATLSAWADRGGIVLDRRETDLGVALGGCVERYLSGPLEEPDHSQWETEIAYLTT